MKGKFCSRRVIPIQILGCVLFLTCIATAPAGAVEETLPDSTLIPKALIDEMDRSMTLRMEDLEKPYFIQYSVDDTLSYDVSAEYGTITSFDRDRDRALFCEVRVGSYELDNTNFSGGDGFFMVYGGGGGNQTSLPLEDDYTAIRQATWWITDMTYKETVETLTKKRTYMKDKNLQDRPHDFTKAPPATHREPTAKLDFDVGLWKSRLKEISAWFKGCPKVQDSGVRLVASAGNRYIVNSEGTVARIARTEVLLVVTAKVQADDGMKISKSRSYFGESLSEVPPVKAILEDVASMVDELMRIAAAPILESYTGPVLFDGIASAQLFREMIAEGLAGRIDPVGTTRSRGEGAGSMEKKLGQRILPRSFRVYDNPLISTLDGKALMGHYTFDDEGISAEQVDLVEKGKLKGMLMSRIPTKKLSGSNGHGRKSPYGGQAESSIGVLVIEDEDGITREELKAELLEAAADEGLEYGLRITSLDSASMTGTGSSSGIFYISYGSSRSGSRLSDPVMVYKVYVADGREELVRGCEFGSVKTRDLKRILAAGNEPEIYNFMGSRTPPSTIVAPPVLVEEMELAKIEQELPKKPILLAPIAR